MAMLFSLIAGLALGAVAVIFALQNIITIPVKFLFWQVEGSLALVLVLAVIAGVIISILVTIPEVIKTYMRFNALKKYNKSLEQELATLKDSQVNRQTTTTRVETPTSVTEKTTTETTVQ
jgi:putative membrane protein